MNYDDQLQTLEHQFRPYEPTLALLSPALDASVHLYMLQFQQRGGITDTDLARVQSYLEEVTVDGDDLYYRSKKWGETAKRFDQVAEIIAVLSFSPGGITVFGLHFEPSPVSDWKPQTSNEQFQGDEEREG